MIRVDPAWHASGEPSQHCPLQRRENARLFAPGVLKIVIHQECSDFLFAKSLRSHPLTPVVLTKRFQFCMVWLTPSLLDRAPHKCPAASALRDTGPTRHHAFLQDQRHALHKGGPWLLKMVRHVPRVWRPETRAPRVRLRRQSATLHHT